MSFRGIIPAVVTPFTAENRIDVDALTANTEFQLRNGVTGFVAAGTMGEANSLSIDERRLLISTVVTAAGDQPVLSGVSAGSTTAAQEYAALAREAGCAGVMCLPPLNYSGTLAEVTAFYAAVADAAQLPVMLYNNPEASGIDLSAEDVRHIATEVPAIGSVKECSGDARRIAELRELTDLSVFVGGDDWALEGFAAGAAGWITGVGNVVPAECVALEEHVRAGRLDEARTLYRRLKPLARLDMTPLLVQYYKAAMDMIGLTGGAVRPPRQPLDSEHEAVLSAAMDALRVGAAA